MATNWFVLWTPAYKGEISISCILRSLFFVNFEMWKNTRSIDPLTIRVCSVFMLLKLSGSRDRWSPDRSVLSENATRENPKADRLSRMKACHRLTGLMSLCRKQAVLSAIGAPEKRPLMRPLDHGYVSYGYSEACKQGRIIDWCYESICSWDDWMITDILLEVHFQADVQSEVEVFTSSMRSALCLQLTG